MKILEIQKVDLASFCYLNSERYPFLLESVNHNDFNRYSILFAFPGESIILDRFSDFDFLNELKNQFKPNNLNSDLPFTGGWFVYLSYELIGQIEPSLAYEVYSSNLPIAYAVKIPSAIIIDHQLDKTYLIDQDDNENRINSILSDIKLTKPIPKKAIEGKLSEENQEKFTDGVKACLDYIVAGDVFQVNLSRQWQYKLSEKINSTIIYSALKNANPAPFSALIQYENFSIISSSPERLFSVNDGVLQTRPIAGTHPRGKGSEDDISKRESNKSSKRNS